MRQTIAVLLAAVLGLAACDFPTPLPSEGGTSQESSPVLTAYTLRRPVYPQFPVPPQMPETWDEGKWADYEKAQARYVQELSAVRGEGLTEEMWKTLNGFAGRTAGPILAGREGENAAYSPLSLWSAMALLARCAGGNSRAQLLDTLGAEDIDALQEEVERLWRGLYTEDGSSSLLLANSVWLNSELEGTYVQETLDALAEHYFAGTYTVPMGTGEADLAVTAWVKEQTNGLIGGGQPVVETQKETLALLASALYYRAGWRDAFSKERTEEDVFTCAGGEESRVDFMHQTCRDAFLRREGYQAARLTTGLGEMIFLLPDEGVAPETLLRDEGLLNSLDFYGDAPRWGEVQWSVPKFDVDSSLDLLGALDSLGVSDVLDPARADLSALTSRDAYVSGARQLARVKVDEEGVEAAAVTILEMMPTSAAPDSEPEVCVMDLDRPFLFVIRVEGVPLFVGVVNQL